MLGLDTSYRGKKLTVKMIYAIGDSHARFCFSGCVGVQICSHSTITLRRVVRQEESLLSNIIKKIKPIKNDILIFLFGEIDIRCHADPLIKHRKKITMDGLLKMWAQTYVDKINCLGTNGAKISIASIPPPLTKEKWIISEEGKEKIKIVTPPANGWDFERALYTKTINKYFKIECGRMGWDYFDIYSKYADEFGMLPLNKGDGTVHIKDNSEIKKMINELIKSKEK
jgi:hypothetical protein